MSPLSEEVKQERLRGLGGSDAGVVLGVSPYKTPYALYREKVGEDKDELNEEWLYWGARMEDFIAQEYSRRHEVRVRRRNDIVRHKQHEWMLGNIDRTVDGERTVLECKTAYAAGDDWGEEGSDQIPLHYLAQVMHYMEVLGYPRAHVAVLFWSERKDKFRVYEVPYDRGLAQMMLDEEREFWHRVERRDPPDPTSAADVRKRWPADNGKVVSATPAVTSSVDRLRVAKGLLKELDTEIAQLEIAIKKGMEDNQMLVGPTGDVLATWKTQSSRRFDHGAFSAQYPALAEQYKRRSEYRVFRVKQPKGDPNE